MLREMLNYKVKSPSNKHMLNSLQSQSELKTNYSTFNSPISNKETLVTVDSGQHRFPQSHTITLSNQTLTQTNPITVKQRNQTQSSIRQSQYNTIPHHKKTLSLPNVILLESLIDELSTNLINKCAQTKKANIKKQKDLENNVNTLTEAITTMKSDLDKSQSQIMIFGSMKESLIFELQRLHKEAFHHNVENIFLNKKIKDMKEEMESLQRETTDVLYNKFKSHEVCSVIKGETCINTNMIKALIDEKKNLATAVIVINKKKREVEEHIKDLTMKCDGFVNRVKCLVDKEKKEISPYVNL